METLPKTFKIHAHKPSIESLLGIKYIFLEDSFMITNISDESIFKHGELRIGHEVVQVNGTPITGQSKEGVRTLLGSLGEAVVFMVKSSWVATMQLKADDPQKVESARVSDGAGKKIAKARLIINFSKKKVPKFLEGRNVPAGVWHQIFLAIDTQLLPSLTENYKLEEVWKKEIGAFEKIQASKQIDIFATGIKHQKHMFGFIHTTALLANSTSTIANNLLLWMNAVLQPYGLLCQLDLEHYGLPRFSDKQEPVDVVRIRGIEFMPIDLIGVMCGFEVSVNGGKSEDASVMTSDTDLEIDTTRWC